MRVVLLLLGPLDPQTTPLEKSKLLPKTCCFSMCVQTFPFFFFGVVLLPPDKLVFTTYFMSSAKHFGVDPFVKAQQLSLRLMVDRDPCPIRPVSFRREDHVFPKRNPGIRLGSKIICMNLQGKSSQNGLSTRGFSGSQTDFGSVHL